MDEQSLNELLECSVCLERLDHTSKVLPCQHTFCRRCLDEIVSTKHELRCPECRNIVTIRVEDLPSNILLIRLLEGLKNVSVVGSSSATTGSPWKAASTSTPRRQEHPGGSSSSSSSALPASATRQPRQANQPCAKALYNYDAKENGDLSFKKGDIVTLRKQIDENWYHGELSGQHGFFPASYVHVIVPLPQIPQCRALYDFDLKDEKEKDCLSFQKDEILIVIRRVDDNWVEGKKGDKIGIFPISFVEMNEAARSLINTKSAPGGQQTSQVAQQEGRGGGEPSTSPPLSLPPGAAPPQQKRHSLTLVSQDSPSPPSQHQRRSLELGSSGSLAFPPTSSSSSSSSSSTAPSAAPTSASAADSTAPQASLSSSVTSSTSRDVPASSVPARAMNDLSRAAGGSGGSASGSSHRTSSPPPQPGSLTTPIYTALFHYKPQKEDELELRKGDYYTVAEKCQDGWFKGQCLRTGTRGVFPGNYVQIVRPSSAFKPVNPNVCNVRAAVPVPPLPTSMTSSGSTSSSSSQPTPRLSTCVPAPTNLGTHGNRSAAAAAVSSGNGSIPPPLLPRVAKNSLPSASGGGSGKHSSSRSGGAGGGGKRSSSASAHNHSAVGGAHASSSSSGAQAGAHSSAHSAGGHVSNAHGSSPKWPGAGVLHPMSTSSTITPPNAVVGQLGESSQGASRHGHGHSDRDKERERGRDKDRDRREKKKEEREKKSLVKLLYSKSKKSKSPAAEAESATPRGAPSSDAALALHTRSGSYPSDSSQGATGDSQHRKTASLDSTPPSHAAQPPHSARPSRPKPLARERYRCIVSYPPQTEHELELTVGDIVYVHKKREDGWFKGTHEKTAKTGMFPGSFVEKAE